MRVMGIDYGEVRIGIAFSDELKMIATPFGTYNQKNKSNLEVMDYFCNLIKQKNVNAIVIGLPLNMRGEEEKIAKLTKEFGEQLFLSTNIMPIFIDERLTSVYVNRIMNETNMSWQDKKNAIDKMSAAAILQTYLDKKEK